MSEYLKTKKEYSYLFEIKPGISLSVEQKEELKDFANKIYPQQDNSLNASNYESIVSPNVSCFFSESSFLDENYPNFPLFLICKRVEHDVDISCLKISHKMKDDLDEVIKSDNKDKALDFCKDFIKNHRLN